jgi:penicillin-binding protein 1A
MSDNSNKNNGDFDERYYNDPEYRKQIRERNKEAFNLKKRKSEEESGKTDASNAPKKGGDKDKKSFNLKKSTSASKQTEEDQASQKKSPEKVDNTSSEHEEKKQVPEKDSSSDKEEAKKASTSAKEQDEPVVYGSGNIGNDSVSTEKKRRSFNTFLKYAAGFLVIAIAGGVLFFWYLTLALPSLQELENPKTDIASFVKSRDGANLDKYFVQNRTYVSYNQISEHAIDALLSTEDHRFYTHWGVDVEGILATVYDIATTFNVRGASTITMQLARNLYRKIGFERSIVRKLREMITAVQIERSYTKREIIEMYLNTVEFPNSAFGIEAASLTHYGKNAKDLNVLEASMMIGSLKAVYAYNPRLFPERSKGRRDIVLSNMFRRGFLSQQEYESLAQQPNTIDYHPPSKSGRQSRYFGEYVRLKMLEWCEENGYDLYRDGLVIYTTIDSRLQQHAETALQTKLDSLQSIFVDEWTSSGGEYMDKFWKKHPLFLDSFIEETKAYKNGFFGYKTRKEVLDSLKINEAFIDSVKRVKTRLQAGLVGVNPKNGHILTWIGGADFADIQFDNVYQSKRQAGSTFKPFVYTVAIDNGYPPYTKLSKYPISFYDRMGGVWKPSDESVPSGPDMVTLRQALARSMNNVTVRLLPILAGNPNTNKLEDLYPAARKIVNMAHSLGINSDMQPNPSIALGTAEVSLLEMVSSYTTFANQGVHIDPIAITRIEDKEGNVLAEFHPTELREVISPETAYLMIDMLRGVVRGVKLSEDERWAIGTGIRLRNVYGVRQDVAGKTGTTQNSADNWFIAMMPHIVTGAWVGGEDRRVRFPSFPGYNGIGQGARTALPIIGDFINRAKDDPNSPWSYDAFEQPRGFVMPEPPEEDNSNNVQRRVNW